jgi:hypothetical protein
VRAFPGDDEDIDSGGWRATIAQGDFPRRNTIADIPVALPEEGMSLA